MPRAPLLLVLLMALPAIAGCTLPPIGPPPPVDPISPQLVRQAFLAPALQVSIDNPFANVRLTGQALAVPVLLGGDQAAAVYVGPSIAWRTDAIFAVRERGPYAGDVYVQPPAGEWAAHRERAAWQPASVADLSAAGFADERALFLRASSLIPPNHTAPKAAQWFLNGSLAASFEPNNVSLATVEGSTFVFQRNTTGFLSVENSTVVNWNEQNRTVVAKNDGFIQASSADPEQGTLTFTWSASRVDVRLRTPPFKVTDLQVEDDRLTKVVRAVLPGVGEASMVSYVTADIRDNRVEFRSQNMTLLMAP